ncbi:hypothetical protein ACOJM8_000964 [Klebsiella aerogenes]
MNNELTAALLTIEKCRELSGCPAGVDLQDWVKQLAAENVAQKNRTQQLIDIINNADNAYCMCGDAMKNHTYGGCGHPTGMFDYHYGKWLEHGNETTATDRIVAGIKADGRAEGINFAASRLAAAFNHGHVDKPMAEVGDVVRMILTAKEDLANDPALPEDGLSGEYAEKSLAEWEAELREGADK